MSITDANGVTINPIGGWRRTKRRTARVAEEHAEGPDFGLFATLGQIRAVQSAQTSVVVAKNSDHCREALL